MHIEGRYSAGAPPPVHTYTELIRSLVEMGQADPAVVRGWLVASLTARKDSSFGRR